MALQVWLPLNGSIENQGLLGVNMNGDPASWASGKMGNCAVFSGSQLIYTDTTNALDYLDDFTWCCWVNLKSGTSTSYDHYIFTVGRADYGSYGYGANYTGDTTIYVHFGALGWTVTTSGANTWNHIAFTKKGTAIKIYVNGALKVSETFNGTYPTFTESNGLGIGGFHYTGGNIYKGSFSMNDFRIYDNALSDREIHEIAKGLVVHYPLNDVYCTGASNLYSGEYAEGKCSHGNFSPTKLSGERGYNYKLNYTGNGSNAWHSFGFPTIPFTVGKTYDYSCKIRCRTNNCSLYMRASRCHNDWTTNMKYIDPNGVWTEYHIRQTMTGEAFLRSGTTDTPKTAPELEFYTGAMTTNGTVHVFDLDIKDVQICEANTSIEFADGSFNTNIVYDVSGFGNHGTRSGKLYIDSDSPRNDCCYNYKQTGYIHKDDFNTYFSQFTIAYWIKIPSSITAQHFICGAFNNWTGNGFGAWRESSAQQGYQCIMKSTAESNYGSFKADGIPHNTWTHIAYVYTGTQIKTYINGSLVDTKTYGSNGQCYMPNVFLGNSMFGNRTTENDEASMSDFRLYATALSDKDIAELYNSPMCITNNGALMTQGEFKEV